VKSNLALAAWLLSWKVSLKPWNTFLLRRLCSPDVNILFWAASALHQTVKKFCTPLKTKREKSLPYKTAFTLWTDLKSHFLLTKVIYPAVTGRMIGWQDKPYKNNLSCYRYLFLCGFVKAEKINSELLTAQAVNWRPGPIARNYYIAVYVHR